MLAESAASAETPIARPHYITQEGRYLFAWHHPPRPTVRRHAAIVLCPPLGSEYICAYRVWRILAEQLAGIGFDVLRFDYEGTGDSAGDPEERGRLAAWIGDIERVVAEARELAGSSDVALIGLRIGATLALQAAAALGGVDRLVLWSPFRSGRAYVRELKAFSHLSRKDYTTKTDEGPDILAAGYILPGEIARALEGLDVDALSIAPARHILIVDRDDRSPDSMIAARLEKLGSCVERIHPAGTAEMLEQVALSKVPEAALEAITVWLRNWRPDCRPGACAQEIVSVHLERACGSDYRERGARFGPADRLFGILNEPNSVGDSTSAVLLLNTGLEYRVGPHRLYVPLAREWAARGHYVLRYDLGGIGDSAPPPGAAENVAYPEHALDDLREAIAFIRKEAPGRRVIVAGLCSGGWYAFRAAREGLAVDAVVSVNPPLYLRDGSSKTERQAAHQEIGSYRRALRDPASWRKVLGGRASYRNFVRFAAAYLARKAVGRLGAALGGPLLSGLARDLDRIATREVASFFVFSRGDGGLEYFRLHASAALQHRTMKEHIRYVVVDGAGHTFSPSEAQHALRELLVDFVARETSRRLPLHRSLPTNSCHLEEVP